MTRVGPPSSRELTFSWPSRDELLIRLAGRWTLAGGVYSADLVRAETDGAEALQRVRFDAEAVTDWDTSLLAFLRGLLLHLAERGVDADRDGLPDGVARLLDLATSASAQGNEADMRDDQWLARLGRAALRERETIRDEVAFVGRAYQAMLKFLTGRARFRASDFALVIQQCGAEALPIVTLVSFLVGLILAFIGAIQLQQFGASIYVADLVALGMAREMGAMMTAIIMAGRTGASFAAQLGTMTANEEIDALETMGLSPMEFLVVPRMLALMLMMPLLCLYSDLLGILGGSVVGVGMLDIGFMGYLDETRQAVGLNDFGAGLIKATVFGTIVAISGCMRGMQCGRSAAAVGAAATSAVVTSIVLIVVASGVINVLDHVLG
jgi:phospholipid/cholesterol/gamma-HCH transport system permease protein